MAQRPPKATSNEANPWTRPPILSIGDKTADDVYTAVGWALSGWESLEMNVVGLFDRLIGVDLDSHASHRAYGAVTIWNIRRDMLRAAADAYFLEFPNQPLAREIDETIKLIDNYASRRNDIAHGIVMAYDEVFGLPGPDGGFRGWVLFPALTSTKAMRLPFRDPKYAYTSGQIRAFGERFRAIVPTINKLIADIEKRETTNELTVNI